MDNLKLKIKGVELDISLKSMLIVIAVLIGFVLVAFGVVSLPDLYRNVLKEWKEWTR